MTMVNDFLKTLVQCPYVIMFVVILIAVTFYVVKRGKKGLYDVALYLVSVAEEQWGSGTGKIKFAEVISTMKKNYPIITLFISEEKLAKIIEDALAEMKCVIAQKQAQDDKDEQESIE